MNRFQKETIQDARIILTDKDHNYLGPDLVLQGCCLVLRTNSRALTISKVQLLDCQVKAEKKITNFQMWCGAVINRCTFEGWFVGNDFGHWTDIDSHGSIENCDFSKAVLDGCRFMDCDIGSIKLPKWPCFTILFPRQKASRVESLNWPGQHHIWAHGLSWSPETTVAEVAYAPELVKKFGGSEDELREALAELGDVVM